MKKLLTILYYVIITSCSVYSQTVIKGSLVDYLSEQPVDYVLITLDKSKSLTNKLGEFEIKYFVNSASDTLKVMPLGGFDLYFINLPFDRDTIHLNKIPCFEYFPGIDMTDFFCYRFDLLCKIARNRYYKKEKKRIDNYYLKQNGIIDQYELIIENLKFKIDPNTHCIDLNKLN